MAGGVPQTERFHPQPATPGAGLQHARWRASPVKKIAVVFGISPLALLIVLPVVSSVKQTTTSPSLSNPALRADGSPLPDGPHALAGYLS
jgi:hypothetical protein